MVFEPFLYGVDSPFFGCYIVHVMAHTKAGGSTKNLRDSQPKYLGIKLYGGEQAKAGSIVVRQRGTKFTAGIGVKMGKDNTIYAVRTGVVKYETKRKPNFDGTKRTVHRVSVVT